MILCVKCFKIKFIVEEMFSSILTREYSEKIRVLIFGIPTYDLPITSSDVLPLRTRLGTKPLN